MKLKKLNVACGDRDGEDEVPEDQADLSGLQKLSLKLLYPNHNTTLKPINK
jgi:hypothetical protein